MATFAEQLRAARARHGWSQAELGRRAGVAPSIVNRTERGVTAVSLATLAKLARALGLTVALVPAHAARTTRARKRRTPTSE